jgi:hypothetical protein
VISQPIFYTVVDDKTMVIPANRSVMKAQPTASPIAYSIVDRPRRSTIDMSSTSSSLSPLTIGKAPMFYTVVGSPRVQQPTIQLVPPSPSLYSTDGNSGRTSRAIETEAKNSMEPAPILYTIVGDASSPRNGSNQTRPLPATTNRSSLNDVVIYTPTNEIYSTTRTK